MKRNGKDSPQERFPLFNGSNQLVLVGGNITLRCWEMGSGRCVACEGRHLSRSLKAAYPWEGFLSPFSKGVILLDVLHPIDMYRVFHVLDLMATNEFAVAVIPYVLICLGTHIDTVLA